MSEVSAPDLEALHLARRAGFALPIGRLRAGEPAEADPGTGVLPERDRAFVAALLAALGAVPADPAIWAAFWVGQDVYADLDPAMALKARFGGSVALIEPEDRAWLQIELTARLNALFPDWGNVSPRAAIQRFDARAAALPADVALAGRTVAGLLATIGGATGRLGAPRPVTAVPLPEPVQGRTVWVKGQEVQITSADEMRLNLAIGTTVGVVAFLAVLSRASNWVQVGGSPYTIFPVAVSAAVAAGGLWVAYTKLDIKHKSHIERFVGPIYRHGRLFAVLTLGTLAAFGLMWSGLWSFGLIVLLFCVGVAAAYIKEW